MAARNAREGARGPGITPQVHGDPLTDTLNREAAAEIEALKKKAEPPQPKEGEAPLTTGRSYLRVAGIGWPYVTADVTVNTSGAEATVPSSGMGLGTLYVGEQVHVDFFLWGVVTSGSTFTAIDLLGSPGQGSPNILQERTQPFLPAAGIVGAQRAWFAAAIFTIARPLYGAALRFRIGSGGGSIAVHDGDSMFQRVAIYTPITKASE